MCYPILSSKGKGLAQENKTITEQGLLVEHSPTEPIDKAGLSIGVIIWSISGCSDKHAHVYSHTRTSKKLNTWPRSAVGSESRSRPSPIHSWRLVIK